MSYNSIYCWKNFLDKEKETEVKPDTYILNFYIVNQNTSESFYKWYSFKSEKELLGFIKFIALPSGYYSRLFGEKDNEVIITADTYDSTLALLGDNIVKVDEALIKNFQEDYAIIEEVEKEFSLDKLKQFCQSFNDHLNYRGIVFSNIDVYENIKTFGKSLVEGFEEDGMVDELERQMEMSKEEIINLFSNIEENTFMLKRINEFLNSKFLL